MLQLHAILHPTDFSSRAEFAFRLACSLAQDHGARLVLLHVMPTAFVYGEVGVAVGPESYRDTVLEQLHRLHAPAGVEVEYRLEEGDPADTIVRTAEEAGCDLIVLGTHGRRGLTRLLMGSVAEQVVRRAPCPVLTAKTPAATAAETAQPVLQQT
ncbi:MAG: universal stress protein [Planctomycetia bacterium]|nr:universal stress protein [Planctomycetia bacterium]